MSQKELTVRLEASGSGYKINYYLRGGRAEILEQQVELPKILGALSLDGLHRDAQERLHVGDALYKLLFPDEANLINVFKYLGESRANTIQPNRYSIRLRIWTSEPELLSLPWGLTSWDGQMLIYGPAPWTFELSDHFRPKNDIELLSPASILLMLPLNSPADNKHPEFIRGRLTQAEPSYNSTKYFIVVHSWDEAKAALKKSPQLIYYIGHASQENNEPVLNFDDELINPKSFRDALSDSPPKAVFLNGCGSGQGGQANFGHQLVAYIPVVINQLNLIDVDKAQRQGSEWLVNMLLEGLNPVKAIHHAQTPAIQNAIHARFNSWTLQRKSSSSLLKVDTCHLLDRISQRAQLRMAVDALLKKERRTLAVVATSPKIEGAHPEELSNLLRSDIAREKVDQVLIHKIKIQFPRRRDALHHSLETQINQAFDAPSGADLVNFIQEVTPEASSEIQAILWLEFGIFGKDYDNRSLKKSDLLHWLDKIRTYIGQNCPKTVKIIAFLCIVSGKSKAIGSIISNYVIENHTPSFICKALPPVEHVSREELVEFFLTSGTTRCDPSMRVSAIKKLMEICKCKEDESVACYKCLCDEIDYAEHKVGWREYTSEDKSEALDDDEDLG